MIRHYVAGQWQTPADHGTAHNDAASGVEIFRVSAERVYPAAAIGHARAVGLPTLRALSFLERAQQLKELARHLNRCRSGFAELSAALGATADDAADDFDGGLRALRHYANAVSRALPGSGPTGGGVLGGTGFVVDEPEGETVGRDSRYTAQRLAVGRPGIALQINGFSLPVRTALEKFAQAYLAGMPSVIRPSSRTAAVVAWLVEGIVEAQVVPDGSLQLLTGPIRLTDCFTAQDLVSFTGTRACARLLHESVADLGVEPRCEFATEQLNCAVLGPDVAPGTAAFRLFVGRLVAGLTSHAGQTTDAVRRAFVPSRLMDEVADAVAAALADVRVGGPAEPRVGMGPLIDVRHRRVVRNSVERLSAVADVLFGENDRARTVGGDPAAGAFMSPVLLRARSAAGQREIHQTEAYGPASTLIPYRSASEIGAGLALGRGGLRSWIVTSDPDMARELTSAIAPWHSRIQVVDPALPPDQDTAPDAVECLRQLRNHLGEVTVEASPQVSGAVSDRWVPGAERRITTTHPLRIYLNELRVGDSVVAGPRLVSRADIDAFADLTGDHYYAHTDEAAAAGNPLFGGIVAHGHLVLSLATGMFVTPEPGPVLANRGLENLRFLAPVRPGDELTVTLTAKEIALRPGADRGDVRWHVAVTNQHALTVARYDLLTVTAIAERELLAQPSRIPELGKA
jgi:oxepin-CoA hydrolase / 3-oxo-5,6-dehydrosuberyl-CoA semialdehyde dehydrogenase